MIVWAVGRRRYGDDHDHHDDDRGGHVTLSSTMPEEKRMQSSMRVRPGALEAVNARPVERIRCGDCGGCGGNGDDHDDAIVILLVRNKAES
jgi:hypothetical protein